MDCREVQFKITSFIKDKLTEDELSEFISHVKNCDECKEELKIYYAVEHLINGESDFEYKEIDRILSNELNNRQQKIDNRKRKRFLFNGAVIIAELLLLISAILVFFTNAADIILPHISNLIR